MFIPRPFAKLKCRYTDDGRRCSDDELLKESEAVVMGSSIISEFNGVIIDETGDDKLVAKNIWPVIAFFTDEFKFGDTDDSMAWIKGAIDVEFKWPAMMTFAFGEELNFVVIDGILGFLDKELVATSKRLVNDLCFSAKLKYSNTDDCIVSLDKGIKSV